MRCWQGFEVIGYLRWISFLMENFSVPIVKSKRFFNDDQVFFNSKLPSTEKELISFTMIIWDDGIFLQWTPSLRVLIKQEFKKKMYHTRKKGKTLYSDIVKCKQSKSNKERKSSKTKTSAATQHKTTIEQLKTLNIKNKEKPPSRSN